MATSEDLRPVLATVDGSGRDPEVAAWAAVEAARHGTSVRLVHAVDVGVPLVGGMDGVGTVPLGDLDESGQAVLAAAEQAARAAADVQVEVVRETGSAAAVVLDHAQQARCVVLGAGRRSTLDRMLLGTVSVTVAAHSPCPVVLVPDDTDADAPGPVVVGLDGSRESGAALLFALAEARARKVGVRVVTSWYLEVVDGAVVTEQGTPEWESVEGEHRAMAQKAVDTLSQDYGDVEVAIEVRRGPASKVLLEAAADASLLVVGNRGRGGFGGLLLGSVTRRVLAADVARATAVVHAEHR